MTSSHKITACLFDLDGTLADTAPDLANALNKVRLEQQLLPLSLEDIRPHVSNGSVDLIRTGFNMEPDHTDFESLRLRLVEHYFDAVAEETTLFPQMAELLAQFEQQGIHWGVVTNKPERLTDPLMAALGLTQRAACIVSGDTTAERKPHPLPIHHACGIIGIEPQHCLYVGDARRDIEAGRRAGTKTLIAMFGYIMEDDNPDSWGADGKIDCPSEILPWITGQ